MNFYPRSLSSALKAAHLQRTDRLLIVRGGERNHRTLSNLGFISDCEPVLVFLSTGKGIEFRDTPTPNYISRWT